MMSEQATTPPDDLTDDEKLTKFKLDISRDADVVDDQRDQANEDMRFINVTGGMWENFLDNSFLDRVKLEFDIVSNFLQRFLGERAQNQTGVEFKPDDSKTSDEDAELLNGIYRADYRNFSGEIATDNAEDEGATCGYGALKLATIFEDDDDPENDNMRIEFRPIYNAYNSVFWDQAAQRIDKRDARWCTVLKPFTKDSFKDVYPDKNPTSAYTPDSRSHDNVNTKTPDFVFVATRYEAIRKKETVFIYNNLKTSEVEVYTKDDHELIKDELKADEFRTFVRERKIMRRSVEKTVFSGDDILDDTRRIVGKHIPIVPFYAYRSYVDGVEWYRGLVRKLKDAARLFNMQVSQLAENAASGGQEVPIFLRDQMLNTDVQALWADPNNKAYMFVDPVLDADGTPIANGPIGYTKPGQLDGSTSALMGIVPAFIQDTTGGVPQDTLNPDASGKAIQALIKRENLTTRKVTKNFADAKVWMGEIYQAMAAEIYSKQRIFFTLGKDGTQSSTQLLKSVMDSETGQIVESNTLKGKKFKAYPDVGPQYETLREQTVEDLKGMLEALKDSRGGQQYTSAIIAVLLDNITGVGLDPIKELNRRIMLAEGLVKPENEEEEALVAQLQQPQEDPNEELIEAVANKENAEARSLDASSLDKVASANKKEAETVEILSDIKLNQNKFDLSVDKQITDQRQQVLKTVQGLPVN